jgi:hypothetical protein
MNSFARRQEAREEIRCANLRPALQPSPRRLPTGLLRGTIAILRMGWRQRFLPSSRSGRHAHSRARNSGPHNNVVAPREIRSRAVTLRDRPALLYLAFSRIPTCLTYYTLPPLLPAHELNYVLMSRTLAPSIPIYAKNTSAVPDRYDQQNCLRAGRIWQRSHLLATARGLAGRPCNEAIEMIDHERAQGNRQSVRLCLQKFLETMPGSRCFSSKWAILLCQPAQPSPPHRDRGYLN